MYVWHKYAMPRESQAERRCRVGGGGGGGGGGRARVGTVGMGRKI